MRDMATRPLPASQATAPASRARYTVVFFAVTLAILSYIDRVCISMAMPNIAQDLQLSKAQQGSIFAAFGIAYALFEIPGGWLGDLMGPRKVLMRIVIWWSAFTALTGAMTSFVSLWITRFLFGAGEAGCFPNITKAFSSWLPKDERVRAQGILWMSARWGGAFTPPLVIAIFAFMNWRWAFVCFGLLGVVWAVFFYAWFRDKPSEHKSVNAGELALLAENERNVESHGNVPWGKLFGSRNVWLLWLQYFFLSYPWYFYITWLPSYLQENRGLTPQVAATYAILPLFFGGLGSLVSGFVANRVALAVGSVVRARQILACTGFAGGAVLLIVCINTPDPLLAMVVMGLASFCNDLVMPGAWATCMDIGGRYAGTVAGSMNMMGNIAGFVAPAVGGMILQRQAGDYNTFIYTMAAMYVLGVFCWPFIRSDQRID
jgi:MFS transporter, ACS family, glucarate transporter